MANSKNGVPEQSELKQYRFFELPADCVVFDDMVYRMKKEFDHPGGDVIKAHLQRDVSVHYRMMHAGHDMSGAQLKKQFTLVGRVQKPQVEVEKAKWRRTNFSFDSELATEIKAEVGKIVPLRRGYAPAEALAWYAAITVLFIYLRIRWVMTGGSALLSTVLGITSAHMYLTILHASNHYEISRNELVNQFGQILTGSMGYLPIKWFCKHQEHHAYTQHMDFDPDMNMRPILVKSKDEADKASWCNLFQYIYIHLLGPGPMLQHGPGTFNPTKGTGWIFNEWLQRRTMIEMFFKFIFGFCCFLLPPVLRHGFWVGAGYLMITGTVAGTILVVTFSPNHTFDEVAETKGTEKICWTKLQIEGSANYCGSWMTLFTGSLNYQIEHHLFPRMHAWHYPKIAPVVRRICEKHGVRYVHFPTFYLAWKAVLTHLYKVVH